MIFTLLGLVAVMFILQSILSYGQLKNFNKHYGEMRSKNKVAIGRSRGLITTGVVLLIRIDRNAQILEVRKMQGITVFASFKDFPILNGKRLVNIDESSLNKLDRFTKKALKDAQHTYQIVQAGGTPPRASSPIEKVFNVFKKKGEVSS